MTRGVSVAEFRGLAVAVRLSALLCVCASLCWAVGCSQGMQSLVNDLDGMLTEQVFEMPEPGEEKFQPLTMLSDQYLVGRDSTLCLFAPKASSYKWQIYRISFEVAEVNGFLVDYQTYEEIIVEGKIPITQRNLVLYIPDLEDIFTAGTYKLVLTVIGNDNIEYKDTAALVIYEPFYPY